MALEERQIQRYARQVLLHEVGGQGQQALLAHGAIALSAGGAADSVALAYLAAGGSPVRVPASRKVGPAEVGFLFDVEDVGSPAGGRLRSALQDLNPDAVESPGSMGLLAEIPLQLGAPAPWVVIGWGADGRGAVLYRTGEGCPACFIETLASLRAGDPSADSVALGALAALAFQRCTLGLSEPLGGVWVDRGGAIAPLAMVRCEQHR